MRHGTPPAGDGDPATEGVRSILPPGPDIIGIATALFRASDAFLGLLRHEVTDGRTIDLAESVVLGLSDLLEALRGAEES